MLSGKFENCYGLKDFNISVISFSSCNRAIIYAPNGVMKSSLAKVFEDIVNGEASTDRIFKNVKTSYSINYHTNQYTYNSEDPTTLPSKTNCVYVVNSFDDKFEFTKETVSTLLADESTRNSYNELMDEFSAEIKQIEENLRSLSGLTKPKIKWQMITDLKLATIADWTDIFEELAKLMPSYKRYDFLSDVYYSELFNDKVLAVYQKPEFKRSIEAYITSLNTFLKESPILSERFTDRSAEALGKALAGNNLFEAKHTIQLRDNVTVIHSVGEWNELVDSQLKEIYSKPELSTEFTKMKKLLTANAEVSRVRDIIISHREIIPLLSDIDSLKKQVWLNSMNRLDKPFDEYSKKITIFTEQVRKLYAEADKQSQRWKEVVSEFNRRFRVPFKVQINNKANFLLKDEAPNLSFDYSRGSGDSKETVNLRKDDLMVSLSMGEKRALYLLYTLFDLEKIRKQANIGTGKFLIVIDDIADSFDYKNKYAIIEYLNDLAQNDNIDLLMLTHNFDFYRTVKMRLGVIRSNCYIAQKSQNGIISMTEFKYQKDFFKNVIIKTIKDGQIDTNEKKKLLIASIPFYRNLSEYSGKDDDYLKLTCFLHLKTTPLNTRTAKLTDMWNIISPYLAGVSMSGADEDYFTALQQIAADIVCDSTDEVLLENKLTIAIATRLLTETFLQRIIVGNGQPCIDSENNQTRDWFNIAKPFLTQEQKDIIEDVNLITPESIHINSFMYEPLIDISDWTLKELYRSVSGL